MKYKDKTIKFAANLVPLIKNGTKTFTYRIGDKYEYLKMGDTVMVQEGGEADGEVFAEVEITDKYHTTFGDLPYDRDGHERYFSKQEMRDTFKRYYRQEIEDNQDILVLAFKVIKLQ
jgi:uncharacterized protein YhfF